MKIMKVYCAHLFNRYIKENHPDTCLMKKGACCQNFLYQPKKKPAKQKEKSK